MKRKFRTRDVLAAVLVVLLVLVPVIHVTYQLITVGANFGRYGLDDLFPEFNDMMSGRKTAFQKELASWNRTNVITALVVGLPLLLLGVWRGSRRDDTSGIVVFALISGFAYVFFYYLLVVFSYGDSVRTVTLVGFYLVAVILAVVSVFAALRFGFSYVPILVGAVLIGTLFAGLLSPFVGWAILAFGPIFWIVVLFFVCASAGSGTKSVIVVFV